MSLLFSIEVCCSHSEFISQFCRVPLPIFSPKSSKPRNHNCSWIDLVSLPHHFVVDSIEKRVVPQCNSLRYHKWKNLYYQKLKCHSLSVWHTRAFRQMVYVIASLSTRHDLYLTGAAHLVPIKRRKMKWEGWARQTPFKKREEEIIWSIQIPKYLFN